jgi:hypothetical protein
MAAFMMVAVMALEDTGLRVAYRRLHEVVRNNAFVALGGLTLTSLATAFIAVVVFGMSQLSGESGLAPWTTLVMYPVMACGWLLSMFLEQMFVTGLFVYTTSPNSPLVAIMMEDFVGRELPLPQLAEEPFLRA